MKGAQTMTTPFPCGICENASGNRWLSAREMMFGTREEFQYVECGACGCVQLATVPVDLGRYYPAEYYSFTEPGTESSLWQRLTRTLRAQLILRSRFAASRLRKPWWFSWLEGVATPDSRILDIGCGNGTLLTKLDREGFRKLYGYDLYLPDQVSVPPRITVKRRLADDWLGSFDVVMMHHSLEHMPDQLGALREAVALMKQTGTLLIRVPLAGSAAWRQYGADWVQLDAPRHIYLHTMASLQRLADDAGLQIALVGYDSTGFQFYGSELYLRGMKLFGSDIAAVFTQNELQGFEDAARGLNADEDGDMAVFRLRLKSSGRRGVASVPSLYAPS